MVWCTVDPVPNPTFIPLWTSLHAAMPANRFASSMDMTL